MVDAVFEHQGVLDKFIGDGMLAVFGSLDMVENHERRAVLTALRMKARLAKLNGERAMVGQPPSPSASAFTPTRSSWATSAFASGSSTR